MVMKNPSRSKNSNRRALVAYVIPLAIGVLFAAHLAAATTYDLPSGQSGEINADGSYDSMTVSGDLTVKSGAKVETTETTLGGNAGDSASITVSGSGSKLTSSKVTIGGASGGAGRIATSGGGLVYIGQTNNDDNHRLTVAAGAVPASGDVIDVLTLGSGSHWISRLANLSSYPARITFADGAQLALKTVNSTHWKTSFAAGQWMLEADSPDEIKMDFPPNHYFTAAGVNIHTAGSGCFNVVGGTVVYYVRMTFGNTGGFTLKSGVTFIFVSSGVDMHAMRGMMTVNGVLGASNNAVYADGLVIGPSGSLTTTSSQNITLGSGDRDGSFSATVPSSNSVVKVGTGTLTVTGVSSAGRMIVSNGTLRVSSPLTVETLELEDGTTLIVDGADLSVAKLIRHGTPTVTTANGGRLVLPIDAADADTWLTKPTGTDGLTLLKKGTHDAIVYDPESVGSVHVREGVLRFSAYGRAEKYLRILFSRMSTRKTDAVVKPLTMGKVAIFGADGSIPSDGMTYASDGAAASSLGEKKFAYTAAKTKKSTTSDWMIIEDNVFKIDQGMNNFCLLAGPDIDPEDLGTRFGYVLRLPALSANVSGYDFSAVWNYDYPTDWTVEASATGADGTWTEIDSRTGQVPAVWDNCWWSGGGRNAQSQTFEFPGTYVTAGVTGLADSMDVRVDSDATVDFSSVVGGQSVNSLTIDAATGAGTIINAKIATNGTLNVVNSMATRGRDALPLALTLSNPKGLKNFESWTVYVNGVQQHFGITWADGRIVVNPSGSVLIVF